MLRRPSAGARMPRRGPGFGLGPDAIPPVFQRSSKWHDSEAGEQALIGRCVHPALLEMG